MANLPVMPPPLRAGDTVAVVAPAGPADVGELEAGIALLERCFTVTRGPHLLGRAGYLAGTDDERLADLSNALADPDVRAVVAARGGYGSMRLLDRLDFGPVVRSPKWVVGCSDLTALLVTGFAEHRLPSIHGPMVAGLARTDLGDVDRLIDLLLGQVSAAEVPLSTLVPGSATGPLIGGNLCVLSHLAGCVPRTCMQGAILFLEDVGEAPYRLDRCLVHLGRSGLLDGLAGIVVGELVDCPVDRYGVSALEAVAAYVRELAVPAAFGYPASHGQRNRPFVHGATATLECGATSASLRTES